MVILEMWILMVRRNLVMVEIELTGAVTVAKLCNAMEFYDSCMVLSRISPFCSHLPHSTPTPTPSPQLHPPQLHHSTDHMHHHQNHLLHNPSFQSFPPPQPCRLHLTVDSILCTLSFTLSPLMYITQYIKLLYLSGSEPLSSIEVMNKYIIHDPGSNDVRRALVVSDLC